MKDIGRGGCIKPSKGGDLVADDQEELHPQRMVRENAEEDVDNAKLGAAQRRPVRVTEIRTFDQFAAERAAGRHIAFNDAHAKLQWLIAAIAVRVHPGVRRTQDEWPVAYIGDALEAEWANSRWIGQRGVAPELLAKQHFDTATNVATYN
jgi:hypothetical protein